MAADEEGSCREVEVEGYKCHLFTYPAQGEEAAEDKVRELLGDKITNEATFEKPQIGGGKVKIVVIGHSGVEKAVCLQLEEEGAVQLVLDNLESLADRFGLNEEEYNALSLSLYPRFPGLAKIRAEATSLEEDEEDEGGSCSEVKVDDKKCHLFTYPKRDGKGAADKIREILGDRITSERTFEKSETGGKYKIIVIGHSSVGKSPLMLELAQAGGVQVGQADASSSEWPDVNDDKFAEFALAELDRVEAQLPPPPDHGHWSSISEIITSSNGQPDPTRTRFAPYEATAVHLERWGPLFTEVGEHLAALQEEVVTNRALLDAQYKKNLAKQRKRERKSERRHQQRAAREAMRRCGKR